MMNNNQDLVFDILVQVLGDPRTHYDTKGQASWNCPECDEGRNKGNFEVNYIKDVYRCWSCDETNNTHGSIYKLIKKYGNNQQLKNYILLKPEVIKKTKVDPKKVFTGLPEGFVRFKDSNPLSIYHKQAYNYIIKDRGLTDEILDKYNIGYTVEGHFHHRIIIPSHNLDNKVNYFSARSYIGAKRKYDNPESSKETLIFNEYYIDWNKDVYLVEGALDHLVVENSIPMLGKKLHELLWNTIYDNLKANIVIAYDPDAMKDMKKLYVQLNGGKLRGRVKALVYKSEFDLCELHKRLPIEEYLKLLTSATTIKENKL